MLTIEEFVEGVEDLDSDSDDEGGFGQKYLELVKGAENKEDALSL